MGCCEATNPFLLGIADEYRPDLELDRRTAVKGLLGIAGAFAISAGGPRPANAQATKIKLAFCGQLLCVVPYEVTRARGHFQDQGLDVELVYTRGGNAAMQALVGGAVDYAGTSFDVALAAFARGAKISRFATTGRLPLFALAVSPQQSEAIKSIKDLENRTVGVSALGNADHALLLFLLEKANADPKTVRFATLGTNLLEPVRLGQVDAAMVQEPALSLIVEGGGRELVNFMNIDDAVQYLGGAYEFMGVTVRAEEREKRLEEMKKMAAALRNGLADTRTIPPDEIIAALPKALLAGGNIEQLKTIIARYRELLYPEKVTIDMTAAQRVLEANQTAETIKPGAVDLKALMDTAALGG